MSKFVFLVLVFSTFSCSNRGDFEVTDHYDGKKFFNPDAPKGKGFLRFLQWQLMSTWTEWPESPDLRTAKSEICESESNTSLCVTYIGHSTVLIQHRGISYLTDPIWSKRASPFSWIGPSRFREPGLPFTKLPKIDYVLISHNHYDHLDLPTLKRLNEVFAPQFLVPLGDAALLKDHGIQRVTELDWRKSIRLSMDQVITFERAQHFSRRGLFDRNKSLWGGYSIRSFDRTVFFAGDTGYGSFFEEIRKRNNGFDLALLPIGAYEPRDFMQVMHMNPDDAIKAHKDLGAKKSMGIHFGTFRLTSEGIEDPVTALKDGLTKAGLSEDDFIAPLFGQTIKITK